MRDSSNLLPTLLTYLEPDAPLPSGSALAHILLQLTECEIDEGGPYKPLDVGFNIAVALFLRMCGVRLPRLDEYIEEELQRESIRSQFLTKAQLAELIERYQHQEQPPEGTQPLWSTEELRMLSHMRERLTWRLMTLPKQFSHTAEQLVERTIRGNPDKQMALMPLYMRQALGSQGSIFDDSYLAAYSLANVFFWSAFIVYDDFWDEDEAAAPRNLPIANLFARHYIQFYSTEAADIGSRRMIDTLMDKLDAANSWEIEACRMRRDGALLLLPAEPADYKDFGIKFYPAAGHALGPILMLLHLGYAEDSEEVKGLLDYFRHYLIAMQLNDDAHDWKEDLERGHISTTVSLLLET